MFNKNKKDCTQLLLVFVLLISHLIPHILRIKLNHNVKSWILYSLFLVISKCGKFPHGSDLFCGCYFSNSYAFRNFLVGLYKIRSCKPLPNNLLLTEQPKWSTEAQTSKFVESIKFIVNENLTRISQNYIFW